MAKNSAVARRNEYDFGSDFNYNKWTEDTVLTMVNVNWNSDYRDIVRFPSQSQLDAWINRQSTIDITKMSMLKFGQNVRINLPMNQAMRFNYARADNGNGAVGDRNKNYYYFILDYRYVAPNTTELVLQVDAWQTFGYDVKIKRAFVERGHIGIANSNGFNHYGRDYLTTPEGMDIGGEYRTIHANSTRLLNVSTGDFSVLVVSTIDLTRPVDDGDGQPLVFTAAPSLMQGLPTGAAFYVFKTGAMFQAFMRIRQVAPWVTQGILSVAIIPSITRYHPTWGGENLAPSDIAYSESEEEGGGNTGGTAFYAPPSTPPVPHTENSLTNWRGKNWVAGVLGEFSGLLKFLTYPYMIIELTTFTGSPVILKPDSWQHDDAPIMEMGALVPPGQRVVISPRSYNTQEGTTSEGALPADDFGDFINTSIALDNFPQLPIVNNGSLLYLANNKNGIQFQYTSAEWSQQKAMHGADATFDVAGASIANTARQAAIGNTAQTYTSTQSAENEAANMYLQTMNAMTGMGVGVAGMGVTGASGAAGGLMNPIISGNNANLQMRNAQAQVVARGAGADSSNQMSASIRDTNVGLQRYSAKGDYGNTIAGIEAKVQDAKMIQPSTSGQFGGDAFNLINGFFGYSLRFKFINNEAMYKIGQYWQRYGYSIGRFIDIPDDFMAMTKFTYWKLQETYITQAPIPESFKQVIRGIFEKGVTVWADPGYIGTTALSDNTPKTGIAY